MFSQAIKLKKEEGAESYIKGKSWIFCLEDLNVMNATTVTISMRHSNPVNGPTHSPLSILVNPT